MTVLSIENARGGDLSITQVLRRYDIGSSGFVGPQLFPFARVTARTGKITTFGQDAIIQKKTKRADGGLVSRSNMFMSNTDYTLDTYMHDRGIPKEQVEEAEVDGLPFDLAQIAALEALETILLDYELDCAALATNPANYGSANNIALSGANRWNQTDAPIIRQVQTAKRAALKGVNKSSRGTRLIGVFGSKALDAAVTAEDVRNRVQPTLRDSIDETILAGALGLAEVFEASKVYKPITARGESDPELDIWDDVAIIACVADPSANPTRTANNPLVSASRYEPAYGYGYIMPDYPRNSKIWEHEETNEIMVRAEVISKPIITIANAAYLFTSVTNT